MIGALLEIYQGTTWLVFEVCPITLTTKAFTRKPRAGSTPEFSFPEFPEMFLPHEHGRLLTKVVMFEIIFSIEQQLLGEGTVFLLKASGF